MGYCGWRESIFHLPPPDVWIREHGVEKGEFENGSSPTPLTAHFIPSQDNLFWDIRCKHRFNFYLLNEYLEIKRSHAGLPFA
jgi:hypothetical protein